MMASHYILNRSDLHGQPIARGLNFKNNCSKTYDILRGFATASLLDGKVSDAEAEAFRSVLRTADSELRATRPFSDIIRRVETIFADGIVDDEERAELQAIFESLKVEIEAPAGEQKSSILPLTDPCPEIEFTDRVFSVTGKFAYGSRDKVVSLISSAGGQYLKAPSRKTHYLVVGTFVSRDWKLSDMGNKILHALEIGVPVVSEDSLHKAHGARQRGC